MTALIWSRTVPLFEAPDELSHYRYAAFIAAHGKLPDSEDVKNLWEGFQPPLYYALLAGLIRSGLVQTGVVPVENERYESLGSNRDLNLFDHRAILERSSSASIRGVYLFRMLNVLFGSLLILACFKLMQEIRAERVGDLLVVVWCFVPATLFSAATITNDVLAALLSVCGLWYYQRYRNTGSQITVLWSALAFGFGIMTKSTVLILWVMLLLLDVLRSPSFKPTLSRVLLGAVPLLLGGAAAYRSLSLHPVMDPDPIRLAWINSSPLWQALSWPLTFAKMVYWSLATSVGVLGAQTVWLPGWVYGLFFGFLVALMNYARPQEGGVRSRCQEIVARHTVVAASLLALLILLVATTARFRASGETMNARLLLGYVPGLLAGLALFARDMSVERIAGLPRFSKSVTITASAAVVLLALPNSLLNGIAESIGSALNLRHDASYYSEVFRRGLQALAVIGLMILLTRPLLQRLVVFRVGRHGWVILIACAGALLNLVLLFSYVEPALVL